MIQEFAMPFYGVGCKFSLTRQRVRAYNLKCQARQRAMAATSFFISNRNGGIER